MAASAALRAVTTELSLNGVLPAEALSSLLSISSATSHGTFETLMTFVLLPESNHSDTRTPELAMTYRVPSWSALPSVPPPPP